MDLKGIIAIAGKPGLYKVAAQGRNNIIVQSLENEKKFPAFASDKISALDDISIYTYERDVPLTEVYMLLGEKEKFSVSINHKEEPKKLREYLTTFLPDYDVERVYDTDVKKLFQWYNLLVEKGIISKEKADEFKKSQEATPEESVTKSEPEKATPKAKKSETKKAEEKPSAKAKAKPKKAVTEEKAAEAKPKKKAAKKAD